MANINEKREEIKRYREKWIKKRKKEKHKERKYGDPNKQKENGGVNKARNVNRKKISKGNIRSVRVEKIIWKKNIKEK